MNSLPTESVLVVKDLGIQLTRIGAFGLQTSQFIEQHRVVDVIINEVITMVCTILFMSQSLNKLQNLCWFEILMFCSRKDLK